MKRLIVLLILTVTAQLTFGQSRIATQHDSVLSYFQEVEAAYGQHQALWNRSLYGPILLVNPDTREVYANFPDSAGVLKQEGKLYVGSLPKSVSVANTTIRWGGRQWAMIMTPLSKNRFSRVNLMAHELFHSAQPSLGFKNVNTNNNHLDQKDGRAFLRLELEALKMAVGSSSRSAMVEHLTNAFVFRAYRHQLFPGSDLAENGLELNEGIAEYTGNMVCGRDLAQTAERLKLKLGYFKDNPTYVRSFAYSTTPVYGYLLYCDGRTGWNRSVGSTTNLTSYFVEAFGITLPNDVKGAALEALKRYNGGAILDEEVEREIRNKQLIAECKRKFIEEPHFDISGEKLDYSFDPQNVVPVEDKGSMYLDITVIDRWGVLTVTKGALLNPSCSMVTVTNPTSVNGRKVSGDGWTLELNEGYAVVKNEADGRFVLQKR